MSIQERLKQASFRISGAKDPTVWLAVRDQIKQYIDKGQAKVIMIAPENGGTIEVNDLPKDNYVLSTGPELYVHHEQVYANGTRIITLKKM